MGRPLFLFASALRDDQNQHQHQQQPHHSQPLNAGPKTRQACVRMRWHVIVVVLLLLAILVTTYQLIATSLTMSHSSINSEYDRPNAMAHSNLSQQQQQEQRQQNQTKPQNETGNARKDELENSLKTPQQDEAFSACLLVMDDNHYLIEWLAYRYYT